MEQQIFQCYASEPMEEHFAAGFRSRWNLTHYHDPYAPTVMFGWYNNTVDVDFLNSHKGPLVMVWGGADLEDRRIQHLAKLPNVLGSPAYRPAMINKFKKYNYKYRELVIPLKSYDRFKPTPLGDKIYVYKGWRVDRGHYFKWNEYIQPLINEWGESNFIFGMGHDIEYVHENYYKNCFVYIKPNERGGSTSMWELGHMGRKTIAQNQSGAPNVLEFKDLRHIAELVNEEAKKIGTVQEEVSLNVQSYMNNNNQWLNLNFWK